ncbi:unnamed protein product [Nesidiocoris tenuis]|uniref:Uncharacterized protein n=1 Tax=Nesidiocoris tenuis TaxID=355587 RepID=A0A6H5GGM9_9HEMI|nr:unnamed protein product [Nesidiocoris tenuis]
MKQVHLRIPAYIVSREVPITSLRLSSSTENSPPEFSSESRADRDPTGCACHFADGKKENGPPIFKPNERWRFDFASHEKNGRRKCVSRAQPFNTVGSWREMELLSFGYQGSRTLPKSDSSSETSRQDVPLRSLGMIDVFALRGRAICKSGTILRSMLTYFAISILIMSLFVEDEWGVYAGEKLLPESSTFLEHQGMTTGKRFFFLFEGS